MTDTVKTETYPVMEHFYTIQGEGAYSGRAAYFVRLGGCDVGCVWCDVKESWDEAAHPQHSVEEIVSWPLKAGAKLVVITGGEPLMHDMRQLTKSMKEKGLSVNIETSGAHPFTGTYDWVCFSPKKFKKPVPEVYLRADELKIIVFNKSDFAWAEKHAALVGRECRLFLQAEWEKREKVSPLIVDYVKKNPRWQISVQTHKYMNIP
jgi:7-carboxy-7-deazaguanine synthase